MTIVIYLLTGIFAIILGVVITALPATLSLSPGLRPGINPLSIEEAAVQLKAGGTTGWNLITAAVWLVHERMQYCRRNSFDSCEKAFQRGYGYCQQQAFALKKLLTLLGFEAHVVYGFSNLLPSGKRANHTWVQVQHGGKTENICSIFTDKQGHITFKPAQKIRQYTPFFRAIAGWGSTAVNALAFYRTWKDI